MAISPLLLAIYLFNLFNRNLRAAIDPCLTKEGLVDECRCITFSRGTRIDITHHLRYTLCSGVSLCYVDGADVEDGAGGAEMCSGWVDRA